MRSDPRIALFNQKGNFMNVLIIGGTGTVGSAIASELDRFGANVSILCRSVKSSIQAETLGATPVYGNIEEPVRWCNALDKYDAIIHSACTFDALMGLVDTLLVQALLESLSILSKRTKVIYTGGVWCFGDTKGIATEESIKEPVAEFSWMNLNAKMLLNSDEVTPLVIHPANVVRVQESYVPKVMHREFIESNSVVIPHSGQAHLPLVEANNLAQLYRLALDSEHSHREYIGVAETGIERNELATLLSGKAFDAAKDTVKDIDFWIEKYGAWANGYSLDQRFSSQRAINELEWTPQKILSL